MNGMPNTPARFGKIAMTHNILMEVSVEFSLLRNVNLNNAVGFKRQFKKTAHVQNLTRWDTFHPVFHINYNFSELSLSQRAKPPSTVVFVYGYHQKL